MKCKYYRELFITEAVNSSKERMKLFKLCFNPITMVVRPGGVLLQDCNYNEGYEYECLFNDGEKTTEGKSFRVDPRVEHAQEMPSISDSDDDSKPETSQIHPELKDALKRYGITKEVN